MNQKKLKKELNFKNNEIIKIESELTLFSLGFLGLLRPGGGGFPSPYLTLDWIMILKRNFAQIFLISALSI